MRLHLKGMEISPAEVSDIPAGDGMDLDPPGPCLVLPRFSHVVQGYFGPAGKEGWGLSSAFIHRSSVGHQPAECLLPNMSTNQTACCV